MSLIIVEAVRRRVYCLRRRFLRPDQRLPISFPHVCSNSLLYIAMRHPALLLILLAAVGCFSQEPIRVKVNLVNVSFSVRDSRGALVENLTKDDFEILEDAVPQKIAFFSRSSDVPLTLGLIVDASGSQEHYSKQHKHDLEVFLQDVLGPKDRAFMLFFGNHLRLVSDFTQSSAEIMDGLTRFEHNEKHFPELGPKESRELGTAFYDSIYYSVAEKLANEKGRRALLIFSDGEDNSSSHDMMTAIETAQRKRRVIPHSLYAKRTRQAHRPQ
jgi:Ca-activated chloride channel family protein